MRVVLGADHRGYQLKDFLLARLRDRARTGARPGGFDVIDAGTNSSASVDYPDLAVKVAAAITGGQAERGILVCGSGVGACVAANKIAGIRAAVTHDTYSAQQGVEHDDMNVICLGSHVIGQDLAIEIVDAFLAATFVPEERYVRRLEKVKALEKGPRLPDGHAEGAKP
ncbi:MAG: ribose 5-phosphate isomerase B [Chloroflexota bacterium]